MTELRQRMIACLPRQGLAERAQKMSVRAVRQLAEHSHQAPDLITEEALRQYFLYIKHVKKYSHSASTMALSGIQFCCAHTLHSDWTTLRLVRATRAAALGYPPLRGGHNARGANDARAGGNAESHLSCLLPLVTRVLGLGLSLLSNKY